jgi:hypothetical protein
MIFALSVFNRQLVYNIEKPSTVYRRELCSVGLLQQGSWRGVSVYSLVMESGMCRSVTIWCDVCQFLGEGIYVVGDTLSTRLVYPWEYWHDIASLLPPLPSSPVRFIQIKWAARRPQDSCNIALFLEGAC